MQNPKKKLLFVVLMFLACTILQGLSLAADLPEILPVRAVPPLPKAQAETDRPPDFDGGGTIQRIGEDETGRKLIVIGDRLRYFARGVTFYARTGELLGESKFKVGAVVGYILNEKKQIVRLYMAEE